MAEHPKISVSDVAENEEDYCDWLVQQEQYWRDMKDRGPWDDHEQGLIEGMRIVYENMADRMKKVAERRRYERT